MNYLNTTIRIKPSDHVVILPQKVKRNNHVVILPQKSEAYCYLYLLSNIYNSSHN